MQVGRYRIVYCIAKFILLVVGLSRWELLVYHTLVFFGRFRFVFSFLSVARCGGGGV